MNKNKNFKKNKFTLANKSIWITIVFVIIATVVYFGLIRNNKPSVTDYENNASNTLTTSQTPSAQPEYNDGDERPVGNSLNENKGNGTVKESPAEDADIGSEVDWSKSQSGELVVYRPTKSNKIRSGDTLSGKATTETVDFRLIDEISGVISRGELKVINGRFSGVFEFETQALKGRLDVFSSRPDGSEFNNVEIPLEFVK